LKKWTKPKRRPLPPGVATAFAGDRAAREALGLSGNRSNSHSVYAHQAEVFYTNLLPNANWMAAMAGYGQTEEKLTAGQEATVRRDLALGSLEPWMADFYTIARLAITNSPQQLEMLGIFVPS